MDPNDIKLDNLSKIFEYEKISREIDSCNDIELLKNIAKSHIKLFFKQEEAIASLSIKF
jgi:hypothetical protein